jgi:16S rRNA (cytosine967-C5)-methyltransferase
MNVADHAAVTTTVELAKANKARRASGLVNAVMRRVAAASRDQWIDRLTVDFDAESDEALAVRFGHPQWLVAGFRGSLAAHQRSSQELPQLLQANNTPAAVTLAARPPRSTVSELMVTGARRGEFSPFAVTLAGGDPGVIAAVGERRAGVQDEGSQLVAMGLAALPVPGGEPERWLDMCAGPGGKAALLASLAQGSTATIEAWEVQPHRARLVQQQVDDTVAVRVTDAADDELVDTLAGTFDRVLLDAPCSGAGALRRRPEARWRKSPSDLESLVQGQQRLLHAALRLVRPEGVVAYVTCSPLLEETVQVVETVLRQAPFGRSPVAAHRVDAREVLPRQLPEPGQGPAIQLWPHLHHTDAMFMSLLRRQA